MSVETLDAIVGAYGSSTKSKLANPAATGQPEDQIRTPFSQLLADLAVIVGFAGGSVVAVGETSLGDLKVRPDYAVTVQNALVGHVELKAPGKGADPNKFKDPHDKESPVCRWERLLGASPEEKETLFHPHIPRGVLGDRHTGKLCERRLRGFLAGPGLSQLKPSRLTLPSAMHSGRSTASGSSPTTV